MIMFQERSIPLVALVMVSLIGFPYITCPVTSTSHDIVAEQKAVRQCLLQRAHFKVDVTILNTQHFIGMLCNRNRIRKVEYDIKKFMGEGGKASEYMKQCLQPSQPSAFQHFSELGEKLEKAKVFMQKESLEVTQFPTFDEKGFLNLLIEHEKKKAIQQTNQVPVEKSHNEPTQTEDNNIKQENPKPQVPESSEEAFDLKTDVSEVNEFSIFADGLCYSWLITNRNTVPYMLACEIPCIEELFAKIEKILIEGIPKSAATPKDITEIVHSRADIFGMVSRLIGAQNPKQFTNLGEKWLVSYRKSYQQIDKIYYKDKTEDRIGALDSKLRVIMSSYESCSQESCFKRNSTKNDLPFYGWMKTEAQKQNLEHDLFRILLSDDLLVDVQNKI